MPCILSRYNGIHLEVGFLKRDLHAFANISQTDMLSSWLTLHKLYDHYIFN